jgi:PncC family amidohydrolase
MIDCRFTELSDLARELVASALAGGLTLGAAESCTGGMVSAAITSIPGASEVFLGAVVSYSNEVKAAVLGVSNEALCTEGAVSEVVALQMASGARSALSVDIAVSITGIAGPGGGSAEKPVGTVWMACSGVGEDAAELHNFSGDRDHIRHAATAAALQMLLARVQG